jgi:DNA-binding beta-propeller fold protein YncE
LKVLAHWSLAPAARPTGLALDSQHHRLFSGCGNKNMAILDSDTGKLLATVPIGSGVDGVAFDPQLGALSANGRDGTLSVVRECPAGEFKVVQTLKTLISARTITNDLKTHQAFLPATVPGENGAKGFGVVVVGLPPED